MRESKGEKIFRVVVYLILFLVGVCCLYPLIYVVSSSFSSSNAISAGKVTFLPKEPTILAYKMVFKESDIWIGYLNSFFYAIVGTLLSLFLTITVAYPLSKRHLKGKKIVLLMIVITIWFGGGMIPTYLNFVELGLLNTRMAVLLHLAVSGMNIIVMKTFFEGIPESLEEAALLDGAGHLRVLFNIYLPLSKASIATISLLYIVERWNGYFWPMILLSSSPEAQPLQVVLKRILLDVSTSLMQGQGADVMTNYSTKMMSYATIVVSTVPILVLYPFVSKFFEKGMTLGAVKG